MNVGLEKPVCEIVTEHPETIPVFEWLGIDYCCHGTHTLSEACERKNLNSADVLAAVEAQSVGSADRLWQNESLTELCRHITQRPPG